MGDFLKDFCLIRKYTKYSLNFMLYHCVSPNLRLLINFVEFELKIGLCVLVVLALLNLQAN